MKISNNILTQRWICKQAMPEPSYPLDYHAQLIQDTPFNISKRIDHCLKVRSIQAQFDSFNHTKVTCTTNSFLKYIITLYTPNHSDDDTNDNASIVTNNCTIVEVQRRSGCSMEFVKERRAILQAAKGQGVDIDATNTDTTMTLTIPANLASSFSPHGRQYLKDILLRYVDYFHNQNYHADVQLTCLNHIASMTDCNQSGRETAILVATMVMGDEIGIRDILALVISHSSLTHEEDETSIMVRYAVLRILVNCLSLLLETFEEDEKKSQTLGLKTHNENTADAGESFISVMRELQEQDDEQEHGQEKEIYTEMEHVKDWLVATLLPLVIENIGSCKWWHNASLSCECLRLLLKGSEAIRGECEGNEKVRNVLETAVLIGKENHTRLYQEAQGAMEVLMNVH